MTLVTLQTSLDGTADSAPVMYMDGEGRGHCAWIENGSLRYARYMGAGWEHLGSNNIVGPIPDDAYASSSSSSSESVLRAPTTSGASTPISSASSRSARPVRSVGIASPSR